MWVGTPSLGKSGFIYVVIIMNELESCLNQPHLVPLISWSFSDLCKRVLGSPTPNSAVRSNRTFKYINSLSERRQFPLVLFCTARFSLNHNMNLFLNHTTYNQGSRRNVGLDKGQQLVRTSGTRPYQPTNMCRVIRGIIKGKCP